MMPNSRDELIFPSKVWSRKEVLSQPCPIKRLPGVYAWFFKEIPPYIQTKGCIVYDDLTLLYVGISPTAPPQSGKPPSRNTVRDRIVFHYRGNASGSTLRTTLGCLLGDRLGLRLRPTGRTGRLTFGEGEGVLNNWMAENAFVSWIYIDSPWILEEQLITSLFLPLNLRNNENNPNYPIVSGIRRKANADARLIK